MHGPKAMPTPDGMTDMHQGSQSAEYDDYRLLHKIANDVMDEKDAEHRAMWGDDEDDEEVAA